MYLLEFDNQGVLEKITPNAPLHLVGVYVDKLPISIEDMLEQDSIEQVTEQDKIYYKIKGE